jgi:hypothetical protein
MAFLRRSPLIVIPSSSGIFGVLFGEGLALSFNSALLIIPKQMVKLKSLIGVWGNLLRSFVGKNIRQWDLLLAQAKFAYNRSTSQTTGCSPFEAVYGLKPISPLDLSPLPTNTQFSGDADERTKEIKKLHEQIRAHIEKQNEKYRKQANKYRKPAAFQEGDMVWIHLRNERFPTKRWSKILP